MDRLGRYEIIEQTGTGAMGNVFRARDTALEREIALKTIRTSADVAPEVRQRFYREARACARLQHPNIITVFDMGEVENTAYIAMELLKGADFRRIIHEKRSLAVETKLAACIEVCEAIAHAHRHGVIHRDIKPSNLFLTTEGRTKVLDFGIARLPSSKLTVAGQILGTPNYMAPEQILAQPSDGRADLFSAAVVFFEFLTYAHPFQSSFIPRRIVQSQPDSLFDGNTSLPVVLEKVLDRGLAKDPCLRYQSGDEFAADLRAVLDVLRGNASPSLSGFQLPSQQLVRAAQPRPQSLSAPSVETPDGQDSQEWRLSEALRLLPEFETAIERRDLARARAAVCDLEGRLTGDVRFTEAIRLCRSRLGELEAETVSIPQPLTAPVRSGPPVAGGAVRPYGGNAGKVDPDATLLGSSASPPVDIPNQHSRPSRSDPPAAVVPPPSATVSGVPVPPSSKTVRPERPSLVRRKLLIVGGAVICAVLVLVAGVAALRPVPVESYVATAVVGVASANIYSKPSPSANKVASVSMGAPLHVLRLPSSRDQEWIGVQSVTPKVLSPGYVRSADLRDWSGLTGAAALTLIRTLSPPETGSEEEIRARMQSLDNLKSRFAGDQAAKEAGLDIARLHLVLAQRHKTAGMLPGDWQSELKAARQELDVIAGEGNLRAQILEFSGQIEELLAAPLPPTPPQTATALQPPPPDVSALLVQARQLRQDGDFPGALTLVERVLRIRPGNKDAQALREKIRKAYDAEKK